MKAKEIRDMTVDELKAKESDMAKELFMLKVQNASRQMENPLRIRHIRRDIARVKTIIREKGK
ncbi:MAG: 50S ribosomal protein L29 [Deltaproteobacteria bacterium]|nr:50S ribosomal protein L29 [Deltaproteobacteria bacterium]